MIHSNSSVKSTSSAEQKHKLLLEAGLIRDPLSNDVLIYGIQGQTETGEHAKLTEQPPVSVVCTNGQPNLAVLLLLDLLVKNGTVLYYNGDFDPEGLSIAQCLKNRYASHLKLWRYTREEYVQARSDQELTEPRLKKLEALREPELMLIAECIRETKKAGYQEKIFF